MKVQLNLRVFTKNRSIQRRKMARWQLFKYHLKQRVCMDWVDKPQNYKDLYGILQLLRGSHLNNFPLKTFELGWVAFHSVKFQLKYLDFNLINIRNSSQTSHVSAMGYYPALFRCIVSRFTGCTISIYHNYLLNTSLTSLQSLFWILLFQSLR